MDADDDPAFDAQGQEPLRAVPAIRLHEPSGAVLGPPWWWTKAFRRHSIGVLIVVGIATLGAATFRFNGRSLAISGLTLDIIGICGIALPFFKTTITRVTNDRHIRNARGERIAHQNDLDAYEHAMTEMSRRRDAGELGIRVEAPAIEERNSIAEQIYEAESRWARSLRVDEEDAAYFLLSGTALAIVGFFFQLAAQVV